ncbi:MAG TPA: hypothetical protein VEC38_00150 [Candidatus Binataceae bacterium]|nr:hypothetical protein [Candidatus Binataceae bacterium]
MSGRVALALVRDLFFRSKIDTVASALGAEVAYASDLDSAARRAAELKPQVVFADLSDLNFPPHQTAERIRASAPGARLAAFASHVDLKPLKAAREAGFDLALSRSEFTERLPDLLKS